MQGRVKIAYIIESFDTGGREKVVLDLCNRLNKNIFDVSLVVLSNDKLSSTKFLDLNVSLYSLNINQKELRSLSLFFKGLSQLIKILKTIKPNIIHSHMYYMPFFLTSLALRISKLDCFHFRTVHTSGLFYENQKTLLNQFRLLIEKIATKINQTYLIAISNLVHKNNIKYFIPYVKDMKLIYNGIDLNKYDKNKYNTSKKDFGLSNEKIVISYVARLDNGKNHKYLIDIWSNIKRKVPNAILCFAGDGILKKELIKEVEVKNFQNSIKFLGSITNVPELLSVSDIGVFPSSFEGFSLVMLEKFAMCLPVVASDIDVFKEIGTDGENCFLVSLQDKELFAQKVIKLCEDKNLRVKLGKNARKRAEDFAIKKCLTSHEEYYLESLN